MLLSCVWRGGSELSDHEHRKQAAASTISNGCAGSHGWWEFAETVWVESRVESLWLVLRGARVLGVEGVDSFLVFKPSRSCWLYGDELAEMNLLGGHASSASLGMAIEVLGIIVDRELRRPFLCCGESWTWQLWGARARLIMALALMLGTSCEVGVPDMEVRWRLVLSLIHISEPTRPY